MRLYDVIQNAKITHVILSNPLSPSDFLQGGGGANTIIFMDSITLTASLLSNTSSIENFQFTAGFVVSSSTGNVELNNGIRTISHLDTSEVHSDHHVIIGGVGNVTLASGVNNTVYVKDGVDTTIVGGGTGNDTYTLGAGHDTVN